MAFHDLDLEAALLGKGRKGATPEGCALGSCLLGVLAWKRWGRACFAETRKPKKVKQKEAKLHHTGYPRECASKRLVFGKGVLMAWL